MRPIPAIPMPLGWGDIIRACLMGPGARERFEEACRSYHGAERAYAVSSGRVALWVALKAAARVNPRRRKVILPAYTCPTVGRAVLAAGLEGLCVDVSLADFNIDAAEVERFLDEQTLAVVAPHMFGTPCEVDRIKRACEAVGAVLVEDVAQACGARYKGRLVGTFGDLAFLSLGRSKNLRGYKGGVLLVNSEELAEAVEVEVAGLDAGGWLRVGAIAKQFAISACSYPWTWNLAKRLPFVRVGAEDQNFDEHPGRLAAWQAGLGLIALRRVDHYNQRRREVGQEIERRLESVPQVRPQQKGEGRVSVYTRLAGLVVGVEGARDAALEYLQGRGIDARWFYSRAMYQYEWWEVANGQGKCPNAERVVRDNLVLPVFYGMGPAQMAGMVAALSEFFGERSRRLGREETKIRTEEEHLL